VGLDLLFGLELCLERMLLGLDVSLNLDLLLGLEVGLWLELLEGLCLDLGLDLDLLLGLEVGLKLGGLCLEGLRLEGLRLEGLLRLDVDLLLVLWCDEVDSEPSSRLAEQLSSSACLIQRFSGQHITA
jgi:hypothetical protein